MNATPNVRWLIKGMSAAPDAEVEIGRERHRVRGRRASDDEQKGLWPRLVSMYSAYDVYKTRTRRQIPVVVLEKT